MAHLRVRNLPPFANNECLKAMLGEYTPILSRVKWGNHSINGVQSAYADLTVPDDFAKEIFELLNGVDVLGNQVSVSVQEKKVAERHGNREYRIRNDEYIPVGANKHPKKQKPKKQDGPLRKNVSPENTIGLTSEYSLRADACKHCGSVEHFSRKCPNKSTG